MMISEALHSTGNSLQRLANPAQQVTHGRKKAEEQGDNQPKQGAARAEVQPEELFSQIKALTEDGLYSIRFESDEQSRQLVVKIVDKESQEVIRQIPAEELLGLRRALTEFQGNFVDTTS
jgi:flagellar protein FlaG